MNRRAVIFVVMWAAAIGAALFIWLSQPPSEETTVQTVDDGVPVRGPDDETAPEESRVDLPISPPREGPPRMFRNDRRNTGRSAYAGPGSAELLFAFETEGRISAQAVVAEDGSIYVGSHDHHLYKIDAHGTEQWKRNLGDRIYATPLVDDDGHVYCGSDDDLFTSFTASGETRFRLETQGDADTGAVLSDEGTIHFAAGAHLWAIERDGTVKWRFEARSKIFSTPAVDEDGTVYFGSQDDHLYAVAADGRMRWSYEAGDDADASPVIGDDGTVNFGSDDHRVYALTRDGELRWSTDLEGYVRAPLALGARGEVIAGVYGPRPRVVSLDGQTGEIVWFFPVTIADSTEIGVNSGALVDRDGNIYVGAHDDFLYALSAEGHLRWIFEAQGDVDGSPVLTPEGTLLVGADDGMLYAIRD